MTAFAVPANLAFDTYDALIAAINDWLDRNDLDGVAPQMIALAEDEISIEIEPLLDETDATITVASGAGGLPSDFGTGRGVFYDGRALPQVSLMKGRSYADGTEPYAFTLERAGIRLWPACDANVQLVYRPALARLGVNNSTNEILSRFPSLYFYGAMVFAHGYIVDDERANRFRALFDMMLEKVRQYYLRQRHTGPLVPNMNAIP